MPMHSIDHLCAIYISQGNSSRKEDLESVLDSLFKLTEVLFVRYSPLKNCEAKDSHSSQVEGGGSRRRQPLTCTESWMMQAVKEKYPEGLFLVSDIVYKVNNIHAL